MRISQLRLMGFQSFGCVPSVVAFDQVTYLLGPNGSGKTAVLEALSRLFSPVASQRKVRLSDFHVTGSQEPVTVRDLWVEALLEFPEANDDERRSSIPPHFLHMSVDSLTGIPHVRVRLTAEIADDGEIDEKLEYILRVDEREEPLERADMSRFDRGYIEVHYLPARRDPADHISYSASSLLGRTLRAVDWTTESEVLDALATQITDAVASNISLAQLEALVAEEWATLYTGEVYSKARVSFGAGQLEDVLRQLTISFAPGHAAVSVSFQRLSDGQKSLLYISMVLAWRRLATSVLTGASKLVSAVRMRPPVHMIVAVEEPENSLAPHYLGRVIAQLRRACAVGDVQAVLATHAPALLRRVEPEAIRFLRLGSERETQVRGLALPKDGTDSAKYVREAVRAYPELYFSRLVILGEGGSEQVVLERLLSASELSQDAASISVVPLGGRHVHHFWRLLEALSIPYLTLLDLDSGRHRGGWGRVKYALDQLEAVESMPGTDFVQTTQIPAWDDAVDFPRFEAGEASARTVLNDLEDRGVFFSAPIDLDLMMLGAFPDEYGVVPAKPDAATVKTVLGKGGANSDLLDLEVTELFDVYAKSFIRGSKPATHLTALAEVSDADLVEGAPEVLRRLVARVQAELAKIPE